LALQGRLDVIYDFARYNALLHEWFSSHLRLMNFSYPPHALFPLAVFGALPYLAGLLAVARGSGLSERTAQLTCTEIALIAVVWTLPFGLCILLQTQGLPALPLALVACVARGRGAGLEPDPSAAHASGRARQSVMAQLRR
jgi:hypothetical protein